MSKKIALLIDKNIGLDVLKFLKLKQYLLYVYLVSNSKNYKNQVLKILKDNTIKIYTGKKIFSSNKHLVYFKEQKFDALICVYWPWILNKDIYSTAKKTINFHPSYLPYNKGWYPLVHSINNKTYHGITLHRIEEKPDEGAIWSQKIIKIKPEETSKDIYLRTQYELFNLFKKNWSKIINNKIKPKLQKKIKNHYHTKKDVEKYDIIKLNKKYLGKDLIDQLRSRTFGKKTFSYFKINNTKIYIHIQLSKKNNF